MSRTTMARAGGAFGPLLILGAAAVPGLAQQPSQERIAAVRQSCRSDYVEHCSNVPTGGAASLNCLRQYEARLAPACRQAVAAIGGGASGDAPGGGGIAAHGGGSPLETFREE